jgi:hypothetical protein
MDTGGACRIAGSKFRPERSGALFPQFRLKGKPYRGVGRGRRGKPQDKIGKVKARAARHHREFPPAGYVPDSLIGQADKFPGIELLGGIADINKVVGEPGEKLPGRFGGSYIHTPVHLH